MISNKTVYPSAYDSKFCYLNSKYFFMVKFILLRLCIVLALSPILPTTAQEKTSLVVQGLKETVEVLRDQWGVNHIYAKNQQDLFFAQGYCAAKDRLFQFEIWRRQATGTTSEILGARELKRDIGTRLFKFRGNMDKELNHYHPQGKEIITAYVNGVNAYINAINQTPEQLPVEFKLLNIQPKTWTPEVVISRHQGLLGNITQELNIALAIQKIGIEKVKNIVWFHPKDPNLQMDPAIRGDLLSPAILDIYQAFRKDLNFTKEDVVLPIAHQNEVLDKMNDQIEKQVVEASAETEGSNNWIVSGRKSASGYPLLANDPHRKIATPSLRYMVHLVAPGWNVVGGGEPVIPGVSIGHNNQGAWGLTIFETDGEDLYVYDLNPNNLNQYKHKGKWVNLISVQEKIAVKNAPDVTANLFYTVHGPVTYIDSIHHKAYAVKCAWLEPGGAPYLGSLRMNQAADWESFREACAFSHIPGENMIWADKKGNIGWQTVGIVPVRKNFSGYVPIPGDGRYEWGHYLPIKERPHVLNPAKGFFATANQHVTPNTYKRWDAIGYTWADAFRGNRVNQVLSQPKKFTLHEMAELQHDYFSIPASELIPLLSSLTFADKTANDAKEYLNKWNFTLNKESIAAAIYTMWEKQITSNASAAFIPAEAKGLVSFQLTTIINILRMPEKYFKESNQSPDQARDAFLAKAFTEAISALKNKLGTDMSQWQYGQTKFKHVHLNHPLADFVDEPLREQLNIGPLPRGGSGHTPGSTGNADNQSSGASFRLVVDTKDWDQTLLINAPGQSGDPASPYYRNLFETWANDRFFPSYFSRPLILKHSREIILLQPER